MILYTFQPQSLVDLLDANEIVAARLAETNLYQRQQQGLVDPKVAEMHMFAYQWMARKLCQKTGLWFKDVYGTYAGIPTDSEGDYIDEEGQKLIVFPFWCWYITDGKNEKPDSSYAFDRGPESDETDWNLNHRDTKLLTLDVPDKAVLLSDANAWYCALEGRPCFEYETDEEALTTDYMRKMETLKQLYTDPLQLQEAQALSDELWEVMVKSWDNILRLEGRWLRSFMGMDEKHDIQAVIPFIQKNWVVEVEGVCYNG